MNAMLFTLDFINDVTHPKGKIAHNAERIKQTRVIEAANQAIEWARKHQIPVSHVKVGFNEHYLECPKQSPMFSTAEQFGALKLNSWGTEFNENLATQPHDPVIIKHRISAFYGTDMETLLRAQSIDTVILCGVATNYAVEHCARDAHDRDYKVIILSDACQAASQQIQEASLASLARLSTITTVNDFITLGVNHG